MHRQSVGVSLANGDTTLGRGAEALGDITGEHGGWRWSSS